MLRGQWLRPESGGRRTLDRLIFVSADGHAIAPPETFAPYLEHRYQDLLEELIAENQRFVELATILNGFSPEQLELMDEEHAIRSGGALGAWDVKRRLQEMD